MLAMSRALFLLMAVLPVQIALAADIAPCKLVTPAEVTAALGAKPAEGAAQGPNVDEGTKARTWVCNRQVGKQVLSVNVAEFPSPQAAAASMKLMMDQVKADPRLVPLAPVPGLGDQSVWGANREGAMWVVIKGRYLLNVTVAGELADPQSLREPARKLTAAALGRLEK